MALGRNGYVQPVEIVSAGVGPARNGWVQPVEIVGGGGGGGAVGDIVDATGSTTDSYVAVTGFPVSRADGLVGIGSILNTGANGMNVRETVTDKFGNTQSVVTVVAAGDEYMLDLQTNFADAALPPFTDYLVEVESESAGNATDYELHFIDITPGTGSAGESLEDARLIGDTFSGDVYWDDDAKAVFGRASGEANRDYLEIYSDKTGHVQVFNSTSGGTGTTRAMSWQMDGVEVMNLDPTDFALRSIGSILADDGGTIVGLGFKNYPTTGFRVGGPDIVAVQANAIEVADFAETIITLFPGGSQMTITDVGDVTISGKLTVTGAIDPTSLSLSGSAEGANVLYVDSANGASAGVSAVGHGRIRYNNSTHTWQISMNGGAYANISTGSGSGDWLYDGNTVGTVKSIGTIDNFDFPFIANSIEGCRLHNTLDSDAVTHLVNFLIGRTTQSDVVEPFSYKLPLDIQREHNQSTYGRITNTVNDTHSVAGWISESVSGSQVIVSIMAPNANFSDMRAGGAAALQVSGATEVDIFSEDNVPIRIGVADTEVVRFVSTGMEFPGTLMSASLIDGVIVFADRTGFDSGLIVNNKPVLEGVASPDGGANSLRMTGSHFIAGFGTNDASTGRGLIAEKSDGTIIGELFFYNNGTPLAQIYVGGVAGGNNVQEWRFEGGARKTAWFGGTPQPQGSAIPDASGGAIQDAEARAAINSLLAVIRGFALIAT